MNIKKVIIDVDLDDPKQVYWKNLTDCRNFMYNNKKRKVFQEYCKFYNIDKKEAKKIEPRFRNFWAGRIKDEPTLNKYMDMIETLEKE